MRPARPKVTQAQYELLAELRHSLRRFSSFSDEAAAAADITPAQHQALLVVKGFGVRGPVSIGDLADRLCIRHHSAVGLVDRLIAQRYVRRVRDAADRRRVHLALSARGEKILESLSAAHRDELRRIGPHIESLLERLRGDAAASASQLGTGVAVHRTAGDAQAGVRRRPPAPGPGPRRRATRPRSRER